MRKMLGVLLLSLVFGLAGAGQGSAATKVMRLGTDQISSFFTTIALRTFAENVEKETGGSLKIEVYDGGQLGQEKACIEQVQFGALDFAKTSISPLSEFIPELNILNFPYLYRSFDHLWKVLEGDIGKELLGTTKNAQMVGICWLETGSRNFYGKKPLRTVEDYKGLKIRVPESQMMMAMVEALGAHATPMPSNDVYSALQTGVCDAAENSIPRYLDMSHQEIAPFLSVDCHNIVPEILLMSLASWEKCTPEEQQALLKCGEILKEDTKVRYKKSESDTLEAVVKEHNVTVFYPTPEDMASYRAACQPVYDAFGGSHMALINRIEAVK